MNTPPPVEENMDQEIPIEEETIEVQTEQQEVPVAETAVSAEAPVNVFSPRNNTSTTMFANRMETNQNTQVITMNTANTATAEEELVLGEKAQMYKDDMKFLDSVLMPIMKKYFPSEPNLNGEMNILQNVLKHDAVVVIRVQKMLAETDGSVSKEEFVEKVEDYLDELYVDKDDIEDTLEITLKYLCGMKQNLENYVEYDFFCSNIPGYREFVDEMKKHRVVTMTNRHMFYNELHGYLHKQAFDNYNFASAVYDFDTKMKEYVETQKQNNKRNNKNTLNKNYNVNTVSNMNNNGMNNNGMNNTNMNERNTNNNNKNNANMNDNSMNNNNMNYANKNTNENMIINNNSVNREAEDDIEIEIEGELGTEESVMNGNNNYTRKNNNRNSNNYTRKV
jgi:hypothetical protein